MTLTEATTEAPFGYKADGTPRKRPVPAWTKDPVKVAAAAAKRTKKPAPEPAASNGAAPALSQRETSELLQMLDRIEGEFDERIAEIDAEQAGVRAQLEGLVAEEAQLRERFDALEARRLRLQLGRQAVEVGQTLSV